MTENVQLALLQFAGTVITIGGATWVALARAHGIEKKVDEGKEQNVVIQSTADETQAVVKVVKEISDGRLTAMQTEMEKHRTQVDRLTGIIEGMSRNVAKINGGSSTPTA